MYPLLLFSGSSFVGRHFRSALRDDQLFWTFCQKPEAGGLPFDVRKHRLADLPAAALKARHAIVLLGDTSLERCAAQPEVTRETNVEGLIRLLHDLLEHQIFPVFFSTDNVFDGHQGNYREVDPATPVIEYGRQKAAVEQFLSESGKPHLLLRLSKIYGLRPGDGTLITGLVDQIQKGEVVRSAADQIYSPIWAGDVVQVVLGLLEIGAQGIYHVGGPAAYSRSTTFDEVAAQLQKRGMGSGASQQLCSIDDFGLRETRPKDTSLNTSKLWNQLPWQPLSLPQAVEKVLEQI
ncbi:MAG: sugar nucleotide-binding protein [Candidatus Eremiobacteraeota bacterium]|nr:sugar nucleotide-binding protein [Candidatus Eremiobacteraeota bacterium]